MERCARCDTYEDSLGSSKRSCCAVCVLIGYGDNLVIDGSIKVFGNKICTDSLQAVLACISFGKQR